MSKSKVDIDNLSKDERIKLAKVLKEKYNPDGSNKELSWMYQKKDIDNEAYLLGKQISDLEEINLRDDYDRGTVSSSLDVDLSLLERRGKMDLEAKLKEDPLELIKAKEIDQKRKLLENTAKLKKLEKIVKSDSQFSSKSHKKKKHRKRSSSSSSSSSSGDELLSQFLAIVEKKHSATTNKGDTKTPASGSDSEDRSRHKNRKRGRSRSPLKSGTNDKHNDRSRQHSRSHFNRNEFSSKNNHTSNRKRSRSPVYKCDRKRSHDNNDNRDNRRRSRSPNNIQSRNRMQKDNKEYQRSKHKEQAVESKKKLSAEEMARLRDEMQMNAKLRDDERTQRVTSYRKEREVEDKELERRSDKGAGFLRPMVMKHAASASVEENVRRRIHTNQRSDNDSNFLRK